jgi:GR25 family glycosyltransferase involved in LPS biosynthesis
MIVHYINLDSAIKRRESLCKNFSDTHKNNQAWTLSRFAAFDPDHEEAKKLTDARTGAEKACFLSHHSLVMQACQDNDYHWIVEDDICFFEQSFDAVSSFIEKHAHDDWDILFTDLTIRGFAQMVDLFEARKKLTQGSVTYINIGSCPFCSAVSYIINPKRKDKIASVLTSADTTHKTWDIFLADSIQSGKLTAYFTLPYVTTFSPVALESQIRPSDNDMPGVLGRAFRSLMNISPDTEMTTKLLAQLDNGFVDKRADLLGRIMSGFVAEKFPKE